MGAVGDRRRAPPTGRPSGWLALRLIRVTETATSNTWRSIRHELNRIHLVTLATADGRVAQHSAATLDQHTIRQTLDLPEPLKLLDFTTETETTL